MIEFVNANSLNIPLVNNSVHAVITSPPYWNLRDYGVDGQIGRENAADCLSWARRESPCGECYICRMRSVASEVWRVLRNDGSFWLNLGDCYVNKSLAMIPERAALALASDGWIVRRDIIWHKPNAMPDNARDRPSSAHEYIYLLTKNKRYFYDKWAVMESGSYATRRNRRSVWSVPTKGFHGAHFAVWPESLVEIMIKASTSERGACLSCGAQWQREVELSNPVPIKENGNAAKSYPASSPTQGAGKTTLHRERLVVSERWVPKCRCGVGTKPSVVLDTFSGAGMTGLTSKKLRRSFVGIDLSYNYIRDIATERLKGDGNE